MKSLALALLLAVAIVPATLSAQATAPAPAAATDLTGTWNASFTRTAPNGQTQTIQFTFHFTQKGRVLTGTIGPTPERQWKVEKGIVDGNKVTFQVQQVDDGVAGPLRSFVLTLEKGHLKGPQKLEYQGQTAEVIVDAVKAAAK